MKKRNLLLAALLLLVVGVVGTTIAYFTDTKDAKNTFTLGNVKITLTEPTWTSNKNANPDTHAKNLMPGVEVAKDPTVTNTGANPAYVFLKVEAPCTTGTGAKELFEYTPNSAWAEITISGTTAACTNGKATHVYVYGTASAAAELTNDTTNDANVAAPLFRNVTVTTLTGNEGGIDGNLDMDITAYAIQSEGYTTKDPVTIWGYFNS